jgi:small subunit ribosomal protein S14
MAKQSMIQREIKRNKLVKRYSSKRQEILKNLKNTNNLNEIFLLQKNLQRLPTNSLPVR